MTIPNREFVMKIRTEQDMLHIKQCYMLGRQLAQMNPELVNVQLEVMTAETDMVVAMANGIIDYVNGTPIPTWMVELKGHDNADDN